jgi:hypothetical protein
MPRVRTRSGPVDSIHVDVCSHGDFNAPGVKGWEWFEPVEREDGSVAHQVARAERAHGRKLRS